MVLLLVALLILEVTVNAQVFLVSHQYDQASQTTSYTYRVDSNSVGHWVLGLEICPEIKVYATVPATPLTIGLDEQSQISGIKWFGKSATYTVKVVGHVQKGSISYGLVQGAYESNTGVVDGPVCSYFADVVCNAGGPYTAVCHNKQLSVHLLGHASLHAVSYQWSHFIPGGQLLAPNNVATVLNLPTNICLETYRVSLTVTGHDSSDVRTCIAFVFVEDSTPPTIHNIYERDISAQPHDIPVPMVLTAEDECDDNVGIHFTEERVEDVHPCAFRLHRTWAAEDDCGNVAVHTQIISVVDTEPPSLSGVDPGGDYYCDSVPPPCTVEGNDYNEVNVEMREFKTDGPCDCEYTLVRKWIATDCAGNTASESQRIKVYDNLAPSIFGVPDDVTVECDSIPSVPTPSAVDECCGATIRFFDSKIGGSCVHEYTIKRSWTASDSCGNSATKSQDISVEDTEAPVLSGADSDITVECDQVPLPCEVEADDNCDGYISVSHKKDVTPGSCGDNEYVIEYSWVAEDLCGNVGSLKQVVNVVDTEKPTLSGLPPHSLTVDCDSIPVFIVTANDNCDYDVSVSDDETKDITYAHDYVVTKTWTAVDECGNTNDYVAMITVQDNEDPILIGVPDDIHTSCESVPIKADVEATDNCCEEYALDVKFSEDSVSGTCEDNYVVIRTWSVDDCSHNSAYQSQSIIVEDLQAPVMHGLPGFEVCKCDAVPDKAEVDVTDNCDEHVLPNYNQETISGSCKTQYKLLRTWDATDRCGNSVSYTQTIVSYDDEAPKLTNVPDDVIVDCEFLYDDVSPESEDSCDPYLSIHVDEKKVDGTCEYDKTFYRHWTVEDDCGNSDSASQTVRVQDIEPPTWIFVPSETITAEYPTEPTPPEVRAKDNCEYEPEITFNEKKMQFGYICPKAYRLVRAWFVVDRCGNMGSPVYQHVIIDDTTEPTFVDTPEDLTVECDNIPPPFPVHATDHYEDIVVTLRETTQFGTCNQDYEIIRTWSALDSCGNLNEITQDITVEDTVPPQMYSVPVDESLECDLPPPAEITAQDNCDGYLDVSLVTEESVDASCDYETEKKTIYRLWRVSDNCGNVKEAKQTVYIFDTKDPYFLEYEQDSTAECDAVPTVPEVSYHDDCDKNPVGWFEETSPGSGSCPDAETIVWSWYVVDECNHQAKYSQTVTVVDTTPPVLKGYLVDAIDVECDSIPDNTGMDATDNCDYDVDVTFKETQVDPFYACENEYLLFWTWTAKDDCGNTASFTKTISVSDTVFPVLSCNGSYCREYEGNFEVECEDEFLNWVLDVTGTDNCDTNVQITETHVTEPGTCDDAYLRIDSYIGADNCGNNVSYVRTITVVDTTPPVWTTTPNATKRVPYDGDVSCPASELEANDVCDDDVAITCVASIINGVCEQEYTKTCQCTAVDNCGNSHGFVQVIDVYDNEPPEIASVPDSTVECLSYVTPPSEPHVDWGYGGTGSVFVVQRTIPDNCSYIVVYTWTATDHCQLKDVVDQTVYVVDVHPPVIYNVPADETTECHPGAPIDYLTGEDNCDGKVLVVYDTEQINVEGPYCYTLVRSWTAVDHCGHVTVETQTIVVDDKEPPVVSYPPTELTTDCHSLPLAMDSDVSVEDNCESHRNVTFTDEKDPGSCECVWKQYRKWVACDSCGNCVTVTQTVTVTDDTPPVLSVCPIDITVQTGDVPYPVDILGLDTYGSEVDVTFSERRVNSSYLVGSNYIYLLIREWVSADDCGNTVDCTQTVTVIDTIPVDVIGVPKDVVIPCVDPRDIDNIYTTAYIDAAINAAVANIPGEVGDITVTLITDETIKGTCDNEYTWIRCWQTEDHAFNTADACFTITVVDNEPPQFNSYPEVEYAECEPKGVVKGEITASDNCDCGATVEYIEHDFTGGAYSGFVTREWIATDCCGHSVSHSQTVWIADTQPPVWDDKPQDVTVDCTDGLPEFTMNATDECHPNVRINEVSWKEVICEGEYIIFYNWRAVDDEGNWITHELQVHVYDTTPPVLYAGDFGSYVAGAGVLVGDSPDLADNVVECPWEEVHGSVYAKDECSEYPWDVPFMSVERWGDDCASYVAWFWQTTDDCGNEAEFTQTVSVTDTGAPAIQGCPANETLLCGTPLNNPYIGAVDACDPEVEVVRREKLVPGSCAHEYSIEISWVATDRCGYEDSCSQTVTYHDLEDPVLVLHALGNVTVPCDVSYDVPAVSANDDCTDYFDIEYDQTQEDGTCPCEYELYRTWSTKDECGKTSTITQTVTVEDNVPPTLSERPKDVTSPCPHEPLPPPVTATDNCCEVTLDTSSERLNGTCLWNYRIVHSWIATDDCGLTDSHQMTVLVIDTDGPEFTLGEFVPGFIKAECDSFPPQVELTAYDICEGPLEVISNEFKHTGRCEDDYSLRRTWDASDDCGNSINLEQIVQVTDTTPPVLALPEVDSYECNFVPTAANHNVKATDNCDPDPHVDFQSNILGADCSNNWSVMMMWIATDRCGNDAIFSMVVSIDDTLYPVLIGVPADVTVECHLPDVPHVTVEDECDTLLTAKFEEEVPYVFCPYSYSVIRRWTATDRCQNSVEETQNIVVRDDGPPVLSEVPEDELITCKDHVVAEKLTATDECEVVVTVHQTEEVVPGSCIYQYVTIITWSAEDKCGNTVTGTQTVSVNDDEPPELSDPPVYQTSPCDSIPPPPHISANDECSYGVPVTYAQYTTAGSCDNAYTLQRVWTAVDECGNKASVESHVDVTDEEPPQFVGAYPSDRDDPCYDVSPFVTFEAVDNCAGYVQITQEEERINGSCIHEYKLVRWYVAEDVCGNEKAFQYTISVFDYDDPELVVTPLDITEECDEYAPIPEVTGRDSCGYAPTLDFDESSQAGTCEHEYKMFRTWTVTDDCDRTDVHVQTVSKVDTTPPVIDEHEDITAEIGNIPPPWKCTWTDNCDDDGERDFEREKRDGSCLHQFDLIYTCTAVDCVGNDASYSHVIHVMDFTPPVIVGVPADTTVEYQKVPLHKHALLGVSVTDNSDGDGYATNVNVDDDFIVPGYDDNDYTIIRTYWAADVCENRAVVHRTIRVIDNTPPCFDEEPEDATVECDAIPEPCDIFTVGEDLVVEYFESIPSGDYVTSIKRTWKACDHSGNCYSWTQNIVVEDTTQPLFTRRPRDTTLPCDCEGFPAVANLAAIDNCDDFVTVKASEKEIDVECPDSYSIVRSWVATDHHGQSTSYDQTIDIVDDSPPVIVGVANVDVSCHDLTESNIPKVSSYDDCDDDVKLIKIKNNLPSSNSNCEERILYSYTAFDDCGNTANDSWILTVTDDEPPSIFGGKRCVYNSSNDGYGSSEPYKRYNLDDLVSYSDVCDENPHVTAHGVTFNRSNAGDHVNLFDDDSFRQSIDGDLGECEDDNGLFTPKSTLGTWEATYATSHGAHYFFSFEGRQVCVGNGEIIVRIACDDGYEVMQRTISPSRTNSHYDYYFTAQCESVKFSLSSTSLIFSVNFASAELKTFKGEGYWVEQSDTTAASLNCADKITMDGLQEICGEVDFNGDIYKVIPSGMRNNRYCYEATGSSWRSITHTVFNNEVWWVITDFASANPSAYSWITFEDEVIKAVRRARARFGPTDARSILGFLRSRNTITDFWEETTKNSPANFAVTCRDLNVITPGQCQAACYYQNKQVAVAFSADSRSYPRECWCASQCEPVQGVTVTATFRLYQWFEGFYYDEEKSEVWILAHTTKEDMVINMWVDVEDSCGNKATGKVEFWIAPSLEAAAAKGRTCDPPDSSPSVYTPPEFTIDPPGNPSTPTTVVTGISNAIDALTSLDDFKTENNEESADYVIANAYATQKVLEHSLPPPKLDY